MVVVLVASAATVAEDARCSQTSMRVPPLRPSLLGLHQQSHSMKAQRWEWELRMMVASVETSAPATLAPANERQRNKQV